MADITIADYGTVTTAATGFDQTKMVASTATAVINPTFSSVARTCLLYTSPSQRDLYRSRMPSSA